MHIIQLLFYKIITSAIFPVKGVIPHFMLLITLPVFCFHCKLQLVKQALFILLLQPDYYLVSHKSLTVAYYSIDSLSRVLKTNKV
jgi:hypothetical protein